MNVLPLLFAYVFTFDATLGIRTGPALSQVLRIQRRVSWLSFCIEQVPVEGDPFPLQEVFGFLDRLF
jgi:hypothetical protein